MSTGDIVAKGVGASPGQVTGKIVFRVDDAITRSKGGEAVVFVCEEAEAEDREGIEAAVAVVAASGGLTGDAAIMARALGKPCVVGLPWSRVVLKEKRVLLRAPGGTQVELKDGDEIVVDGSTGQLLRV